MSVKTFLSQSDATRTPDILSDKNNLSKNIPEIIFRKKSNQHFFLPDLPRITEALLQPIS